MYVTVDNIHQQMLCTTGADFQNSSPNVTGFGKTRHMGFFVKIKFDVYLISSTLELTYLQV